MATFKTQPPTQQQSLPAAPRQALHPLEQLVLPWSQLTQGNHFFFSPLSIRSEGLITAKLNDNNSKATISSLPNYSDTSPCPYLEHFTARTQQRTSSCALPFGARPGTHKPRQSSLPCPQALQRTLSQTQPWHSSGTKQCWGAVTPGAGQGLRVPCRSIAPSKLGANPPESQAPSGHAVLPA